MRLDKLQACDYAKLGAQNALVGECERGGAKRRRESIVSENSKVPPPQVLAPSATPARLPTVKN